MTIKSFVSPHYKANTYLIFSQSGDESYMIDSSEYSASKKYIKENSLNIKKVFLTHAHHDHIVALNLLLNDFPNCEIAAHPHALKCLTDPRLNLSLYQQNPIIINHSKVISFAENIELSMFKGVSLLIYHTPGHNPASLCFMIGNYLFTGDSWIPGHPVVTKLPGGNRLDAAASLKQIMDLIQDTTIIAPGHGPVHSGLTLRQQGLLNN